MFDFVTRHAEEKRHQSLRVRVADPRLGVRPPEVGPGEVHVCSKVDVVREEAQGAVAAERVQVDVGPQHAGLRHEIHSLCLQDLDGLILKPEARLDI